LRDAEASYRVAEANDNASAMVAALTFKAKVLGLIDGEANKEEVAVTAIDSKAATEIARVLLTLGLEAGLKLVPADVAERSSLGAAIMGDPILSEQPSRTRQADHGTAAYAAPAVPADEDSLSRQSTSDTSPGTAMPEFAPSLQETCKPTPRPRLAVGESESIDGVVYVQCVAQQGTGEVRFEVWDDVQRHCSKRSYDDAVKQAEYVAAMKRGAA
jgi:hypothetical protein